MSARLSLYSPDAGSVLLSFLSPAVSLRGLCTLCEVCLLLRGVPPHDSATMSYGYPSSTTSSAPIKCMRIMGQLNLLRRAATMQFKGLHCTYTQNLQDLEGAVPFFGAGPSRTWGAIDFPQIQLYCTMS
uniref:Uncharacterized protein n=1 Tax=Eutreptiella gymnastica TaxID=73025 RepID=A0A7S4GD17_9EUGL